MTEQTYTKRVYFFGPNTTNLLPESSINLKIGLSLNNLLNFNQRLGEHQRHCPGDMSHAYFPTNGGDAAVRKHLCSTFPNKFGTFRGKGREVISLLVKDVPFLLKEATRYFNAANNGTSLHDAKSETFPLREEQKACLTKTQLFYQDHINLGKEFLWDCKMRFGKTHTAYKLIMAMDFRLTLIITGRPTDTKQAWIKAMDHVDLDFDPNNFIDASKQGTKPIVVDPNKRTIIFVSTQDFKLISEDAFKEKFKNLSDNVFDLIIKDECHLTFDTLKTKEALSKLQSKHTLNLSGTPFLALLEERFNEEAKFSWSYIDEQKFRNAEIDRLGNTVAEEKGQYYWLSPLKVFTICLSPELYEEAEQFSEEEGFTFTKLFSTEEKKGKQVFRNDTAVNSLLNSLSRGSIMPYSKQSHNSHQYTALNLKHTLWFLPGVDESRALKIKLKTHPVFKNYDIIPAYDNNDNEGTIEEGTVGLVKRRIRDVENGTNTNHIGTITLSCEKLTHGVSIPEWGSIFLLSDMKSPQKYFQSIFRTQTPWEGSKHECYVFDFNPNRTLQHLYTLANIKAGTADITPYLTELLNVFNVLCYEDNDFKKVDASNLISKLEAGFGKSTSLIGLQNLFSELSFELDQDLIDDLCDIDNGASSKSKKIVINSNEDIPNGKNSTRKPNEPNDSNGASAAVEDGGDKEDKQNKVLQEEQKARLKAVLKAVPLYLFLTSDESFDDFTANLEVQQNQPIIKMITGLSAKQLKKILDVQPIEKQQLINEGISRFRSEEKTDHKRYLVEINMDKL